jgi:hypothetical protein
VIEAADGRGRTQKKSLKEALNILEETLSGCDAETSPAALEMLYGSLSSLAEMARSENVPAPDARDLLRKGISSLAHPFDLCLRISLASLDRVTLEEGLEVLKGVPVGELNVAEIGNLRAALNQMEQTHGPNPSIDEMRKLAAQRRRFHYEARSEQLRAAREAWRAKKDQVTDALSLAGFEASKKNRRGLLKSALCHCFQCTMQSPPSQIEFWIDDEQTALCPSCLMDTLIGDRSAFVQKHPLSSKSIRLLHETWFNWFPWANHKAMNGAARK